MKPKEQVRELGRRFEIETSHVEHVAALALDLFDGFEFDVSDRPLLAAAARLHDIGYSSDPEHHVDAGLQILKENPLPTFSSMDWKLIGLIVSLHRRNWRPLITEKLIADFGKKRVEKAKALAGVLRIADGLDHSHVQDASIRLCRRGKKVDKVVVCSRWYAGNIPWAEGKSDLWEAVFERTFRIKSVGTPSKKRFYGVVHTDDSALSAARRILYSQYDIMRDQVDGILKGENPEYLHDYRVAMRRFSTALKLFSPVLKDTSVKELQEKLGGLSDKLGVPRDAHVLFDFFQTLENAEAENPEIFQTLEKVAEEAHCAASEAVESKECGDTVRLMNRLLRVELPALERSDDGALMFKDFIRKRLKRQVEEIRPADLPDSPEALHTLRKRCRRARYVAEFAVPVCGARIRRLARRLNAVASALGDLHDLDLHSRQLSDMGFHGVEKIGSLRAQAESEFSKAWKKLLSS